MKKFLCILIYLALAFSVMPADVIAASGGGSGDYYRAVSGMVRSHWRDDYFLKATLKPKDSTIKIDNRTIKLKNKVSVEQDELMIPAEALEALGVQVERDAKGFRARKNGRLVEVTYGDKGMRVNGRKKSMRNAPGLKNGAPVVPESVLSEDGLGFEVDKSSDEVVITNSFQTMRVLTKVRSGMSLPADIQTEQTIAGPGGLYILQFSTADAAKTACETLNASSNILYAEPDGIVLLDEAVPEAVIYNMEVADAEPNEEIPAEAVMYNMEMAEAEPNGATPTDAAPTDAAPAEAEIEPKASYAHLGWGPEQIGSDAYMDYLIGNGKQNASVKVAVLDTGLDTGHSYFAGRQVSGYNMVDGNTSMSDAHGHGTHVSGTVIDVTIGMPNVKIMPVKVLDQDGYGSNIQIANGVYWAADNGAQVINMSLGSEKNYTVDSAVRYAVGRNATVVVAAGNSVSNTKYFSPAAEESAITVAALGQDENTASFSNYGSAVDVAAPGVGIVSARTGGGTTSMDGTSMACPHVAGAAALLLCDNPGLAPSAVESKIRATAEDRGTPGFDIRFGYGILNIGNATDLSDVFLTASLSTGSKYLDYHQTAQIHVTYTKNGTASDVTALARYTSSDAAIATVEAGGILTTGSASGEAVITIAYQGSLFELLVDIGPTLTGLTVSSDGPMDLTIGEQKEYTLMAHYSDGSQKIVTQKSSILSVFCIRDEDNWPPWWFAQAPTGLAVVGDEVGKGMFWPIYEERGVVLTAAGIYVTVGKEMIDHIAISPEPMELSIGDHAKIIITAVCKDGSSFELSANSGNPVSSAIMEIKTSNPAVAAVNGLIPGYYTSLDDIYATGEGVATITANFMGKEAILDVTVRGDYEHVSVNMMGLSSYLEVGAVMEPHIETIRDGGSPNDQQMPCGVVWESSDPGVVEVMQMWEPISSYARLVGVSPGTATITARLPSGLTASGVVTVGHCQSVYLPQATMHITPDQRERIHLRGQFEEGSEVIPGGVTWESSDPTVATVTEFWWDGYPWPDECYVTGILPGTATITARTAGGLEATCVVTVSAEDPSILPTSVTVSPRTVTLDQGGTLPLTATVSPHNVADKTVTWSSDNTAVATVSADGLVTAVAPGTAIITAQTANGITDTCAATILDTVVPDSITISPAEALIVQGFQRQLKPIFSPAGVTDRTILWSSDNESVATVSAFGLVKTVAPGTATITARTYNGKTATCAVKVFIPVNGVTLHIVSMTMYAGQSWTLPVTVYPENASDKRLTWASSDEAVATVSGGVVTALQAGTATITATAADGSGKYATCQITVSSDVPVEGVTLDKTAATLYPGKTLTLTANVLPANAHDRGVTWSTNNSGVARVDGGTVTAVARGQATITATTHNGKTGICLVTVEDRLNGLLLSVPNGTPMTEGGYDVPAGATLPITAKVYPEGIGYTISFTSTNTSVATVNQAGVVKGVKTGQATITAIASDTSGSGRRAAATVKINVIVPVSKVTLPAEAPVLTGTTKKLTAALSPANATYKALTWSSDNETVATVATDGTVTAKKAGTANIKATAHNGQAASCLVRVTDPATGVQITTDTGKAYMNYKESLQLTATVNPGTANKAITWKSSNTAYVTVDANGKAYGKKVGKATVYAATADGSGVRGSLEIQVITPVKTMSLPESDKIFVGRTKKLTIKLTPASPTFKTLTWTSNNEAVATVAVDGTVTAKALGTAVITATAYNGLNDSCTVTVAQPVEKIELKADNALIYKDKSERVPLSADISPEIASDKSLTWKSSNTKVATVDAQGMVTGKGAGKVKITATAKDGSGVSGSISLTVVVPAASVKLNKSSAVLYHNGTGAQKALQLTATTSPKGSKYRSLTWSVESGDAAAVDANGLVTAVKDGTAVVRAKTDNERTADCTVTVRTLPTTLALNTTETTLAFKKSFNLGAEVLMDGTEPALTWTTSNKKVATVSSTGMVKASKNKAGKATITATTKNGKTATCTVMVKSLPKGDASPLVTAPNISLMLTGGDYATSDDRVADVNKDGEVTLKQDGEVTLEAGGEQILVQAENGSPVELRLNEGVKLTLLSHEPVEWRVEDERVVTIDRDGQLTALVEGTTTAACTGESGWTLEIRITVSAAGDGLPLPGLTAGAEPGPSLEPTAAPEPAMTAEPTAAPEPTTAPEPTAEPAAAPEPTTAPEPEAPHEDAPPVPEPATDAPCDPQEDTSDAG